MKEMYDGTVTTDAAGDATVQLPDWFQALNSSFRYQLTPIGQFAQAIVATEVENNQFTIKTDKPFVKVSWQVTGTRQDAWANAHRIPVEIDKPEDERGYYIHPELFGEGPEKSIIAAHHPAGPAPGGPHHSR
jgi:trimeric autotransporter adhesin